MKAQLSNIHDFFTWYLGHTSFVGQDNQHWPSVGWQNFFDHAHITVNGRFWEDIGDRDIMGPLLYNLFKESRFDTLTFVSENLGNVYSVSFAIHGLAFSVDSINEINL